MIRPEGRFDRRFFESNSFEESVAELEVLITGIERLGIAVPAGSRLRQYVRAADQIRRAVLSNNLTRNLSPDLVHQAFLETTDLALAVAELSRGPQDPLLKEKLRLAIGGRGLPQSEPNASLARDTQFELTVAAMCRAAGLSVALAEPDVVVTGMPVRFGIAAKRLKSSGTLEQHVRKARRQIKRAGLDGIIALDISAAVNPANTIIRVTDTNSINAWTEAAANGFVRNHSRKILRWIHDQCVFGVAVYCKALVRTTHGEFGMARRWSVFNACSQTDRRYEYLRFFTARMGGRYSAGFLP